MSLKNSKEPSQRQLRAANLIKQALIEVLRSGRMLDLRLIENSITVSDVRISPDLRIATCSILPFSNTLPIEDILEALEESKYGIRAAVTKKIQLKYSPELRFVRDSLFEKVTAVEDLMKKNADNINDVEE